MEKPPNKLVGVENNRWFLNSLTMRKWYTVLFDEMHLLSRSYIVSNYTLFLHP